MLERAAIAILILLGTITAVFCLALVVILSTQPTPTPARSSPRPGADPAIAELRRDVETLKRQRDRIRAQIQRSFGYTLDLD